jgi:hypothetical protein
MRSGPGAAHSFSLRAAMLAISSPAMATVIVMGRQQTLQSSMYSCSATEQSTTTSICSQQ